MLCSKKWGRVVWIIVVWFASDATRVARGQALVTAANASEVVSPERTAENNRQLMSERIKEVIPKMKGACISKSCLEAASAAETANQQYVELKGANRTVEAELALKVLTAERDWLSTLEKDYPDHVQDFRPEWLEQMDSAISHMDSAKRSLAGSPGERRASRADDADSSCGIGCTHPWREGLCETGCSLKAVLQMAGGSNLCGALKWPVAVAICMVLITALVLYLAYECYSDCLTKWCN